MDVQDNVNGVDPASTKAMRDLRSAENDLREDDAFEEHPGGGRFNRLLLVVVIATAMIVGAVAIEGIRSAGVSVPSTGTPAADDGADVARNKAEIEDLAAGTTRPKPPAIVAAPALAMPSLQSQLVSRPREPSRYAQWAQDKYMKALEAPEMVGAFHSASTLEVTGTHTGANGTIANTNASSEPTVTLHPPASPYTVMAGSLIPAVLVGGINSDLPGPVLAQVSENVFDSATGRSLLIPQGSRLIGAYQSAGAFGQQRVQIGWRRLIFPNTASMDLPQMPGTDEAGYAGFTDQVNSHYAAAMQSVA